MSVVALVLAAHFMTAVPVTLKRSGDGWQLLREGKPYFIKGGGGDHSMDELKANGGNSVRTWGADEAGETLDEAGKKGLTVLVGIWLGHKDQGFHYDDPAQVKRQYESACAAIEKYRDHPALLGWGIGNEMENDGQGDDPKVWQAVEDIARAAKRIDPHHPTFTVIAELGDKKMAAIRRFCPDVDIVGINSYGGAPTVGERFRAANVGKPYVLTEFGPVGQWESPKTEWGAPIEPSSTAKADHYRESYEKAVANQPGLCLGSYAFTWGNKQEATATWFGMFLPSGEKVGAVDVISQAWTGKPVAFPCPRIESLALEGPPVVAPGSTLHLKLQSTGDATSAEWILHDEATVLGSGGSDEPVPINHPDAILESSRSGATIKIPARAGGYRIFVTLRNGHHGAATANVPILAK